MTKTFIAAAAIIAMLTGTAVNTTTETTCGGWTETEVNEITPEMQTIFDEATKNIIGVNYIPQEMIGTQIVSGTNYMYRCESQGVYPGAEKKEVIVTVHVDIEGHISVLNIENA